MRTFTTLACTIALLSTACVQRAADEPQEIARALPTAESVRINLPEAAYENQALGQIADYYVVTRNISRDLNAGAGWVLLLVHAIVQYPATSVDGNVYTWGPHSDALDPAEWRLVVTARDDGSYDWSLDGRSKTVADAAFEALITGNAVPGADPHRGTGTFFMDFDAAERVNPVDNDGVGTVEVTYDLENRDDTPATLALHIETREDDGQGGERAIVADYAYAENLDGSGDLQFSFVDDLDDSGTTAEENATIRSRWLATGDGRADVQVSGGDLDTLTVTASECWDGQFRRVYYADSETWLPTEGVETDCAFADQDLPDSL